MKWKLAICAAILLAGAALTQEQVRERVAPPSTPQMLAPALTVFIEQYRDAAIERGVSTATPDIREAFAGHVSEELLERVRWRIDGDVGLVGRALFQPGAVRAVTLDNVILFANAEEAANAKLWAHELYHVMQYEQWGIGGFAERFIADHRAIEHDAREFRWAWMKATGRVPVPTATTQP
jgi:hypothetical protein